MPDQEFMALAIAAAAEVHGHTSPNPWVGAVVVANGEVVGSGATAPPGSAHAEISALNQAGEKAQDATLYTTLEPCHHQGRTGPCTEAIIKAGITKVVVGVQDPDPQVAGSGIKYLQEAGLVVTVGCLNEEITQQLAAYLHHRRTGRPYVVLKLATTLDGRIAAPDGSSAWITGPEARDDVQKLRSQSDAICVGAGTVRTDDPKLTVRAENGENTNLRRIVFGEVAPDAQVQPAENYRGDPKDLLERLGQEGVLQLLVEGGADLAGRFHRDGLVDRYCIYMAPALLGGEDGRPVLAGPGAPTMEEIQRGRFVEVKRLGNDLRLDLILDEK